MPRSRSRSACWTILAPLLLGGCIEVGGGAVEARWDQRDPSGNPITSDAAKVSGLRFVLQPQGGETVDPCATGDRCRFDCARGVGITGFIIPEGSYAMRLEPVSLAGATLGPTDGVVTPAPVVRAVRTGELTTLSVNLIIVGP